MKKDDKMDFVVENIVSINKTLEFQSKQLESHIKRTELLENRFEPVEDYVKFAKGGVRILFYALSIPGVLALVLKLIGKI